MNCKKCKALLPQGAVYCAFCGRKQIAAPAGRTRPNGTGTAYKRGKTWTVEVVVGAGTGRPAHPGKRRLCTKTAALACAGAKPWPAEKTLQLTGIPTGANLPVKKIAYNSKSLISDFRCPVNTDVENFLHNNAILSENKVSQ